MSLTITIPGAVEATIGATAPAVLTVGVGTPGAIGPAGPGVPVGGTAGQFLYKTTTGVDYATDWTTVNLSSYAPLASPIFTGNVKINSNSASPALVITQDGAGDIVQFQDVTSDTTFTFIDANGRVNTIASTAANAGLNIAHGIAPTTPADGDVWTTTGGLFMRQSGVTKQFLDIDSTQTISGLKTFSNANQTIGNSTAASTINIGTGATLTATTKAVNIGTNGVSGSTTNIALGSTTGTNAITINGPTTLAGTLTASGTSLTLGNSTAASTINLGTGATLTATTKSVNIGTSGVAGSTTNIIIGSTTGTSTTTLQGATNGVTQSAGNNTTLLATTAFVTSAFPGFATFTTPSPTSTTTGISPAVMMSHLMHGGFKDWGRAGSALTSGAGAAVNLNNYSASMTEIVGPNINVAGYSMAVWDSALTGFGMLGMSRGLNGDTRNWSKPFWASGRGQFGYFGDTAFNGTVNSVVRLSVGGKSTAGAGDISVSDPGVGWYFIPGSAMVFQISRGNGTAITNITTSFTPIAQQVFDWKIYSDGAGNCILYINDTQVATTSAGPTLATEQYNFYFAMVEQTATAATRIAYESLDAKIYWGA